MIVAGRNPDRNLVEIVEIPTHPFFAVRVPVPSGSRAVPTVLIRCSGNL